MERSWNCHLRWGSELYPRVCLGQWEAGMMAARPIRGQNAAEVSGLNAATAKPLSPSFHHTCISLCTRKVSSFQDGKRRDKWRMDDSVCKSSHILNLKCTENISFLFSFAQSSDIVRMYRSWDFWIWVLGVYSILEEYLIKLIWFKALSGIKINKTNLYLVIFVSSLFY